MSTYEGCDPLPYRGRPEWWENPPFRVTQSVVLGRPASLWFRETVDGWTWQIRVEDGGEPITHPTYGALTDSRYRSASGFFGVSPKSEECFNLIEMLGKS